MRKFLVVGCGGSGGSTLAYMMDQLTSELVAHGVDSIPAGWQFVHVDVPVAPDTKIDGVGNVFQQGGDYIATGPSGGSYSILDNALSQTLASANSLGEIGTWAPRQPDAITTPISSGAGQMRAVGRMITLSKASEVRSGLERAFQRLNLVETNSEMAALDLPGIGGFNAAEPPLVLVVSSMAGGAGASMALDICRLLSLVPGVTPSMVGVFMVAADVFDGLPPSSRGGVRANALAMLGEIVAAQTIAAQDHDTEILSALGQQNGVNRDLPFARVFPVGRFAGLNRTMFGDGSQNAIYRGLGRGLAALMLSGKASSDFVQYDLTNVSDTAASRNTFGWGANAHNLAWAGFGFASLSMGRDRYGEYAAQRISRTAVDRLRLGHMQAGNTASSIEQVNALVESQWSNICRAMALPIPSGPTINNNDILNWFNGSAFTRDEASRIANGVTDEQVMPFIPDPSGVNARQWLGGLHSRLQERRAPLTNAVVEAAYQWGFNYKEQLLARFTAVVQEAVTQFGLPYARVVVTRIESLLREQLLSELATMASYGAGPVATIPPQFDNEIGVMKVIANGRAVADRLVDALRGQTATLLYLQVGQTMSTILGAFINDVLAPMKDALSESLTILDQAHAALPSAVGLANVATDQYAAWPSDENLSVPTRFDVADNEILITESDTFANQYQLDITEVGTPGLEKRDFQQAKATVVSQTISGLWPVAGGDRAPGGLLEQTSNWQPAAFNRDPFTGKPLTPSRASFHVHVSPRELLVRARAFVRRRNEAFDNFCALSLRDYVRGVDARASEIPARQAMIVSKFNEALNRAVPLISVNGDVVQKLHNNDPVKYRFKFSAVPFGELNDVTGALMNKIAENDAIAAETTGILQQALNSEDKVQRIDIFGSYRNYSPLVFDSVLAPVAQQWAGISMPERKDFWSQRRSRPLEAALPMGESERRALVSGWFVGQITGRLRLPEPPYTSAVEIWDDENRRWAQFPNPLLTPPSQFLAKSYDWLPAVLESILIAVANTHQQPVLSSLRPYTLLRSFYDATSEEPASGLFEAAAINDIAAWLNTGTTKSGVLSRVPGTTASSTPEERYTATKEWLTSIRALAGDHFMEPDYLGAKGGGSFSRITSRRMASATPLFRDIAPDIYVTLGTLLENLDVAHQRAQAGAEGPGEVSALPDLGAF